MCDSITDDSEMIRYQNLQNECVQTRSGEIKVVKPDYVKLFHDANVGHNDVIKFVNTYNLYEHLNSENYLIQNIVVQKYVE